MSMPNMSDRAAAALQAAVNSTLKQGALLASPRGYITLSDAKIIYSVAAMLLQVDDVSVPSKEPGRVDQAAAQTQGGSTETIAMKAVASALADAGASIMPANDAAPTEKAA